LLLVDRTPQSYVDADDPSHLEFDYVRLLADVLEGLPDGPLSVVHLGGGGASLARWVAATRPGSTQVVVEADARLAQVVREQLGTAGFRLKVGDGRAVLSALHQGVSDAVVDDVFVGSQVPAHLATLECVREVADLLRPGGIYVANVADSGALPFARGQAAALASVFAHVAVLADPSVLRGRRFGNVVLAGSDTPFPLDELRRVTARSLGRARVEDGRVFARDAVAPTDAAPPAVPVPPPGVFGRPL
jgi:spermidine synthase